MDGTQRKYWRFYWPLAFMTIALVAGGMAQNYVLLHYKRGTQELAVFTLALAVFGPFRSALVFAAQMSNVLVRGPKSLASSLRFLVVLCVLLTLPVLVLGWTPLGGLVLRTIYNVPADRIAGIVTYLRYFAPLILMGGVYGYLMGLLLQARRTGVVTMQRILHLVLMVSLLALGSWRGWAPTVTLSLSLLLPLAASLVLSVMLVYLLHEHRNLHEDETVPQRHIAVFFLPMVATPVMFALTRPILFGFVTAMNPQDLPGLPNVDNTISALKLALTFSILFQAMVNQFRNVFVTFGRDDPEGVRKFMFRVCAGITVLMVLATGSPFSRFFMRRLQGASGEVLEMAVHSLWPFCLVPLIITWRNYQHGVCMVTRHTGGMFAGSAMRNVAAFLCAAALTRFGLYGCLAAVCVLMVSFAVEAATARFWVAYRCPALAEHPA
jgi:hypothetical protein